MDKPIAVGATAEIFAWENGQVLKLFHLRFGREAVEEEARIARLVHASGAPTPAVGDVMEVDGRFGLLYARVDGVSMLRAWLDRPWRIVYFARQLAQLQSALHALAAPPGMPGQKERLADDLRAAPSLPPPLRDELLARLAALPAGDRLCHGDFHPDNVLLTERGPLIIDWVDARSGNPMGDVARTSVLMRLSQPPAGVTLDWKVRLARHWFHRLWLSHYRRLSPCAPTELARWLPVVAAARLSEGVPEADALLAFVKSRSSFSA